MFSVWIVHPLYYLSYPSDFLKTWNAQIRPNYSRYRQNVSVTFIKLVLLPKLTNYFREVSTLSLELKS